jgi:hypothetical protein
LQDLDNARLTKEAKANDLACLIKEAKALDVKGINSKNTIIVYIFKGSNLVKGSKSRINLTSHIDFTSYIDLIALRKKDKIKAKKANGVELRD